MKQYYFISGLPRSGSTLLSTILNQNPKFHASISGPLLAHVRSTIETSNSGNKEDFDPKITKNIINATFDAFYNKVDKEVIFDTNRLWTNLLPALKDQFPYTKVICCVRDINWIIDSFESLHQKNPYAISTVFPATVDLNVYTRSDALWSDQGGIIKMPYDALKSGMTGPHKDMIMFVEYELLCKNPEGMMRAIYNFIDQPYYDHDFDNVEASYDEYDKQVNMEGLHTTRRKVEWIERKHILPPDVLHKYRDLEVWRS
jgi:sulfotransferase